MANVGDGYQKLHNVEASITRGDVKGADQVLRTISDKTDQDIFDGRGRHPLWRRKKNDTD